MGNLLSSGPSAASQHTPPPPLIPLCISGNLDSYLETYEELAKQEGPNPLTVVDAQRNNVLHALFSSNQPNPSILEHIVKESSPKFEALMSFKNALGCTPVWIAVAYGNHSALPDDVTAEALVECNDRGDSPLLAACSKANLEALQYLSDKLGRLGFEKECMRPNKSGSTPLFVSLSASSAPVLEFLLPHFPAASFSAKNAVGLTPLHVAAERGFLAGVAACLSNSRSSVDAVDKNGATALHIAAFVGDVPCVEALLDAGAKDAKDERGKGPLFVAKIRGHGGCAEAMVKRGFKLSEVEEEELEATKKRTPPS